MFRTPTGHFLMVKINSLSEVLFKVEENLVLRRFLKRFVELVVRKDTKLLIVGCQIKIKTSALLKLKQ
jgi:2-hydroxy-3-keto-5-methylthiopentenyl-1-phosphate phosphatase